MRAVFRLCCFACSFVLIFSLMLSSSVSVLAASENVEDLLSQLSVLQNNDIDPEWSPDIEANEALVETLLQDYLDLTQTERDELTTLQMRDLRAYFATLYEVQGRDADALEEVLAEEAPLSSAPESAASGIIFGQAVFTPSAESSTTSAVSDASSASDASDASDVSESSLVSAMSSASSASSQEETASLVSSSILAPTSTTNENSLDPLLSFSFLQSSANQGPYAFFASLTFGQTLFFICLALILFLFLRFLFSLVSVGPPPGTRRRKRLEQKKQRKENQQMQDTLLDSLASFEKERDHSPEALTGTIKGNFDNQELKAIERLMAEAPANNKNASPDLEISKEAPSALQAAETSKIPNVSENLAPLAESKEKPAPSLPKLGDARTGKPSRMPFSQGDAFDLDAIDD